MSNPSLSASRLRPRPRPGGSPAAALCDPVHRVPSPTGDGVAHQPPPHPTPTPSRAVPPLRLDEQEHPMTDTRCHRHLTAEAWHRAQVA